MLFVECPFVVGMESAELMNGMRRSCTAPSSCMEDYC